MRNSCKKFLVFGVKLQESDLTMSFLISQRTPTRGPLYNVAQLQKMMLTICLINSQYEEN